MKVFRPYTISASMGGSEIPYIFPCLFGDMSRGFLIREVLV